MGATVRVVSAEIVRDGCYLITQRGPRAVLPLLWEFPGGRVREDESDAQALERAVRHRLGVPVRVGDRVLEVRHEYPEYTVVLVVHACDIGDAEPVPQAVNAVAWVAPDAFADYPFPGADQRTVDALLADLGF